MAKQFDYQAILDQYRALHDQANAANEQRYQDILGTIGSTTDDVGNTYSQIDDLLETLGDTERERIDMGRTRAQASSEQDLISRGLGNTTVRSSVQRGIEDDANRANREVTEQVSRQKAGVLQSRAGAEERLGQQLAGFMERRTDAGPDLGLMAQLLNQAGAGDAGSERRTYYGGLSANARAGRNAFGGTGPANFVRAGGTAAGSGGSGVRTYTNPAAAGRGAADPAAQAYTGYSPINANNPDPQNAGQVGTAFDNLFAGQPVISRGDVIGDYLGGGAVNLSDDLNLVGQHEELDYNRLPEYYGGQARTTPATSNRTTGGTQTGSRTSVGSSIFRRATPTTTNKKRSGVVTYTNR